MAGAVSYTHLDVYKRQLQPDPRKRGKRGSVLNISTVYYRTGEKYLSTLTIARVSYEEVLGDFHAAFLCDAHHRAREL